MAYFNLNLYSFNTIYKINYNNNLLHKMSKKLVLVFYMETKKY